MQNYLFIAKVIHSRIVSKRHFFKYNVVYLYLTFFTLNLIKLKFFKYNKFSLFSVFNKHYIKNNHINHWLADIITKINATNVIDISKTKLISMPYVLGYNFNPINIWLLFNNKLQLISIVYQVNNTFGTSHSYVCFKKNLHIINNNDPLIAKKILHVSPFFNTSGYYIFKVFLNNNKISFFINYYQDNILQIKTCLSGKLIELSDKNIIIYFIKYPLAFFRSIFLIHYEALKIAFKKIPFFGTKYLDKNNINSISFNKT